MVYNYTGHLLLLPAQHPFALSLKAIYSFFCFGYLSQRDCCSRPLTLHGQAGSLFPQNLNLAWTDTAEVDFSWGPKGPFTGSCSRVSSEPSSTDFLHNNQRRAEEPWHRSLSLNYVDFRCSFLWLEYSLPPIVTFPNTVFPSEIWIEVHALVGSSSFLTCSILTCDYTETYPFNCKWTFGLFSVWGNNG